MSKLERYDVIVDNNKLECYLTTHEGLDYEVEVVDPVSKQREYNDVQSTKKEAIEWILYTVVNWSSHD